MLFTHRTVEGSTKVLANRKDSSRALRASSLNKLNVIYTVYIYTQGTRVVDLS